MRRGLLIGLLAAGTVLGFGFGFARHCAYHHGYAGSHRFGPHGIEERAADACVRATERVLKERSGPAAVKPQAEPAAPPAATP